MDLQMPVCDGIDATKQIRRLEKQHKHERSVLFIVTGQDSSNDRKAAEDAGADEFLTKPVGPKVLDQWVKKWYPDLDI
jgi:CheY-like chemotaxis protein